MAEEPLESLAFQKMLFASQIEASPDGVLVVSNERKWLSYNQRFIEMWRIAEEVAARRDSKMALQTVKEQLADPERFLARIEQLYAQPEEQSLDEVHMKDGRILEQYSSSVKDEKGKRYGRVWYYRDITARKLSEHALQESEERFRNLVEGSTQGIVLYEASGEILLANAAAERILGLTVEQMMGRTSFDPQWRTIHKDGTPFPGEDHPVTVSLQTGKPVRDTIMGVYKPDGALSWISINSQPLRHPDEARPHGVVVTFDDITEFKQAEERLRQQAAQLEALHQIGIELVSELDLDVLLNSIMARVIELLATDLGALCLYHPEEDVLKVVATNDPNTPLVGRTFQRGEGLAGKIWQLGAPMVLEDYQAWEGNIPSLADRIGHTAAAGVPIFWDGKVQGVITLSSAKKTYQFTPGDMKILSMFATQTAVALQNARLYEQTQQHARQLELEIAERKKTEKALRENQRRYQALFEQTNDAIFIIGPDLTLGTDLVHFAVNQQAADLLGYTVDELVNMPIKNIVAPDTWDTSVEMARMLRQNGTVPVYERRMVKKDGTPIWVEINPLQVYDDDGKPLHVLSIVRDISERKRAEEALQEVNRTLRERVDELAALNQISQTLATVTDMQSTLQIVAETMGQMLRAYNTVVSLYDEALDQVKIMTHYRSSPNDRSLIGTTFSLAENTSTAQVIRTGQPLVVPQPLTNPLTRHIYDYVRERNLQHLMTVPLRIRGAVIGTITTVRIQADNPFTPAEVKLAETIAGNIAGAIDVAHLFEQMQQAKDAAEMANEAKSQFLATMSHELRTPLNGILGYAQILQRDTAVTPRQRNGLSIIEQSGKHLLLLINDILDLAKIEAGKIELHEIEFYLPTFLYNIGEFMRLRAEQKALTFHFESARLPAVVHGDQQRLRQVLINLLGNAIKFTDKGSVTLRIQPVDGRLSATKPHFRFEIEDTGIGISAEELQTIFEPFQQAGEIKRQVEGTGLGLAISQTLIELMGGELQIISKPGEGSRFWFDIPLGVPLEWQQETAVPERNIIGIYGPASTLLIVDDIPENRLLLVDLLSPLGFNILEAGDGQKALHLAKESQPDAIIIDLFMPQMDGFELIRCIRSLPETKEAFIITASADPHQDNRDKSISAGSNAFLAKPIQIDYLLTLLQQHLEFEWLYQPLSEVTTKVEAYPAYHLPSKSELKLLYSLALKGDVGAIRHKASSLIKSDKALEPFAINLQKLAKNFKVNEIGEWLASYLQD